ncbi:MAG TPA: patatin-like phospholipase family protein [Nitrospiria bacterium]|jgi:predicted acylesterase/phospholipase RssA
MTHRIGVVLSTGDLRGVFAHTGFLLALEEMGVPYQAMAGSSAGAIVASIIGSGKPIKEFAEWLKGLTVRDYWNRDSLPTILFNIGFKRGRNYTGIVSTDRLEATISGLLCTNTLESCPVSVYLVATNITKGVKEVFHSGEIAPRAVASATIPILLKAKRIEESYYVDGGVFEITPRSAICCKENLDILIVNQIQSSFGSVTGNNRFIRERWSMLHVLERVLDALYEKEMISGQEEMGNCPCGCKAGILTLAPRIDPMDRLKPEEGEGILRQGFEETLRLLPPLFKKFGEKSFSSGSKKKYPCD